MICGEISAYYDSYVRQTKVPFSATAQHKFHISRFTFYDIENCTIHQRETRNSAKWSFINITLFLAMYGELLLFPLSTNILYTKAAHT